MKKRLKIVGTVCTVLLFIIAVLIFRCGIWLTNTWAHLTIEELIFHLKAPLQGTSDEVINGFFKSCLFISIILGGLLCLALIAFRNKQSWYRITHVIVLILSPILIGSAIYHVWSNLELTSYVDAQNTYSDFIDTYYVNPKDVTLTFPPEKRNLIHIYLESMETTYTDKENGGAFSKNLIPELTTLAQKHEDFSGKDKTLNGAVPFVGSTWTMGALFAQTSGLPLSLPIDGNAMHGQDCFMPDLVTLGDLLEEEGYRQAFLIGSPAYFGGRELYFTDHGNYDMWDYNYFKDNSKIPQDYYVWWGFEDRYLLDFAKEKLADMSQQEEPFNLTILTVDTHYEDGYVCADCDTYEGNNQYANVMRCSSKKIYDFISWIQKQDFYKNTSIVLTGDHLTMDRDFCSQVSEDYRRKVFTTFIHSSVEEETDAYRNYSTFDIFPTTLASLGVQIEGNRLGLGTNLFSDTPTLSEQFRVEYINHELRQKSLLMEDLTSDIMYAKGALSVSPYKNLDNSFTVFVEQLDYSVEICDMRCLVWTKEDRSDAKWYVIPYTEGQEHAFHIPVSDFPEAIEKYEVEVFIYAENTMMYSIGTITVE